MSREQLYWRKTDCVDGIRVVTDGFGYLWNTLYHTVKWVPEVLYMENARY